MRVVLRRVHSSAEHGTLGVLVLTDMSAQYPGAQWFTFCVTLEPAWRMNAENVSCIPAGTYSLRLLWSNVHERKLWHITNVPQREAIEIHIGNYPSNTKGCVLVGSGIDSNFALVDSADSLQRFMAAMPTTDDGRNFITVVDAPGFNTAQYAH